MRRVALLLMIFLNVPLFAGHNSLKQSDSKGRLVRSVVEILNSKKSRDSTKRTREEKKKKRNGKKNRSKNKKKVKKG